MMILMIRALSATHALKLRCGCLARRGAELQGQRAGIRVSGREGIGAHHFALRQLQDAAL